MPEKYHINNNHQVGPCKAQKRPCRFSKDHHFETREEAHRVNEAELKQSLGEGLTGVSKKKTPSPSQVPTMAPPEEASGTPSSQGPLGATKTPEAPLPAPPPPDASEEEVRAYNKAVYKRLLAESPVVMDQKAIVSLRNSLHEELNSIIEAEGTWNEDLANSLYNYGGLGSEWRNRLLRAEDPYSEAEELLSEEDVIEGYDDADDLLEHAEELNNAMDEAFSLSEAQGYNKTPKVLYRFQKVSPRTLSRLEEVYSEDKVLKDFGYLSASEDPSLMAGLASVAQEEGVVFELVTARGVSLQQSGGTMEWQAQDFELERVLPQRTPLRVVGVTEKTFAVADDRVGFHRFFARKGSGPGLASPQVEARKLKVVQVVDESLLLQRPPLTS